MNSRHPAMLVAGTVPRRAVIAAGAIVLALGAIQPTQTLAAPTCDGHRATIVGTGGDDSISGTSRDDVIVALGGDDDVWGASGADVICGGPGDDILQGARDADRVLGNGGADVLRGEGGEDRLEGGYGRDILYGGRHDDRLDGGRHRDACLEGSGSGRVIRCDNDYADLAIVAVSCPDSATLDVPFECRVQIANHGPEPAHIVIENGSTKPRDCHGSCGIHWITGSTGHSVHHPDAGALLPAGAGRTDAIEVTITRWPGLSGEGVVGSVTVRIRPNTLLDAIDPGPLNDIASTPIDRD